MQGDTKRTPDTFEEVERLFKRYRMNCLKREALRLRLVPPSASVVPVVDKRTEGWAAEGRVCEVADLDLEIRACEICMKALTRQEKYFAEARYFDGFTIMRIARELGVSRAEVYRLRQSVVVKSAFVLGWCRFESNRPKVYSAQTA